MGRKNEYGAEAEVNNRYEKNQYLLIIQPIKNPCTLFSYKHLPEYQGKLFQTIHIKITIP